MKNMKKVLGCLRKADNDFDLIQNGDRICVGISGGKDSSTLLYCLYLYQKFSGKEFDIIPIYCHMGFADTNINDLILYFQQYNLNIIRYDTQIADILKLHLNDENKISCSLCARLRRGAIINAAKEYKCNKLALGHHSDDAVETLFMNMIHGGRISTFNSITEIEENNFYLIRPLIYAYENDIRKFANELGFPIIKSGCTNDGNTERQQMKNLLNEMYHTYHCRDNFQLMIRNDTQLEILHPKKKENELK